MLQKERSNQTAMMKYGLIAPLFMLMIVVSSATLASKELTIIEEDIEQFSEVNLEKVIEKPSKTATEVLLEDNIDLSDALIISPALVDEVKASQASKQDTSEVFTAVEQNAEFEGGMGAFVKFLQENIKYPEAAQKANHGGKVYTQFIVNTDGTISDVTILKSVGFGCDEEAMRVIKLAKWTPGKQSGRVVRSRFTVPIAFQLANETKIKIDKEEFPKLPAVLEFNNDRSVTNNGNIKMGSYKDSPPLIYMNSGEEISEFELNKIDPKTIESMDVYKGEKAIIRYGEKAKNGAVVITLKKK